MHLGKTCTLVIPLWFLEVVHDPRYQTEEASEQHFAMMKDGSENKHRGNTSQKTGLLSARLHAERCHAHPVQSCRVYRIVHRSIAPCIDRSVDEQCELQMYRLCIAWSDVRNRRVDGRFISDGRNGWRNLEGARSLTNWISSCRRCQLPRSGLHKSASTTPSRALQLQ